MQPLKLDPNAYFNKTPIALFSEQNNYKQIADLKTSLEILGAYPIIDFDGNFSSLLDMENFGAFSLLQKSHIPYREILAYYNSTYTHSLPIIVNLLDNSIYRYDFFYILVDCSYIFNNSKYLSVSGLSEPIDLYPLPL